MQQHLKSNLADIRIIGITENQDTIEVPFLPDDNLQKSVPKSIQFTILNQSEEKGNHYFTFQLAEKKAIQQLFLKFENKNFDWKVTLEGSQNQQQWFQILDNYRIVSLRNNGERYSFTRLDFSVSNYPFYRLKIPSGEKPILERVNIFESRKTKSEFIPIENLQIKTEQKKENNETIIYLKLPEIAPIHQITIPVKNDYDFHRQFSIEILKDSVKIKEKWTSQYQLIKHGTLSSFEKNDFTLKPTRTKNLRITIQNQDNQPLDFGKPILKAVQYSLTARFDQNADYQLLYGNPKARKPIYDLVNFRKNIPDNPTKISLGKPIAHQIPKAKTTVPLFKNKKWLWAIMAIVVALLGYFTFQMMQSEKMKT